jgi:hypothetical protein
MTQNNIIKNGFAIGIIFLFLTIGFSPIIKAQPQPPSVGSLVVHVVYRGHQDHAIPGVLVVLADKDKHNFFRLGLTDFFGDKTFYLLTIGHTYVIRVLFIHYGHLHFSSVNVTTDDNFEYVIFGFT